MATQINININGFGTHLNGAPRSGSLRDRRVSGYSERVIDTEPVTRWQDEFYTLKPGFSPVGYLHAERKLKKKKKKNCSNGQVCGFSCISKSKTCTANMTTAQFMEHNKAKRLAAAEKRKAAKAAKMASTTIGPSSEVKTYQEAIERGKAIAKEFEGNKITSQQKQEMDELDKELDRMGLEMSKISDDLYENYSKFSEDELLQMDSRLSQLTAESWEKATRLNELKAIANSNIDADGIFGKMKSMSNVDESTARAIVGQMDFDKSLEKPRQLKGKKYKHDVDQLRRDAEEFLMMTGDKVGIERIFQDMSRSGARAYAEGTEVGFSANTVNIGTPAKKKAQIKTTLFHEMAHHIEFNDPKKAEIAMDWVKSRSTGGLEKLSKITGNPKYKDREKAYPDYFISDYVGKSYEGNVWTSGKTTEVLTMGFQYFSSPATLQRLYNKDKDHFYLTLGLIAG